MGKIEVRKSLHIEQPEILQEACVTSVAYVSGRRNVLAETVSFAAQREYYFRARDLPDHGLQYKIIRRSVDNGKTWSDEGRWTSFIPLGDKRRLQRWSPIYVLNPWMGVLLELVMTWEDIEGLLPWDPANPASRTGRILIRHSRDEGATWSGEEQLIMAGGKYDATRWGPELEYGRNQGTLTGSAVNLDEKTFIIPFDAEIGLPGGERAYHAACLFGTWRDDGTVEWNLSAYATVRKPWSVQGGCEPSVAVLNDGTLLMTMRVLVHKDTAPPGISGTRYFVTSSDRGKTWSEPQPLRFDDGQLLNTPACLGNMVRSGKNGRLYLIDNMLDAPVYGHDPRYPLCIAEIDPGTLRLKRRTLTAIETWDPAQGQPETIRFSNWARYEDRETGNLIVFITGCPGNVGRHETCGVSPHSYRYEIALPGG